MLNFTESPTIVNLIELTASMLGGTESLRILWARAQMVREGASDIILD